MNVNKLILTKRYSPSLTPHNSKNDIGMYMGELNWNERHGIGKMTWNDGREYVGEWKNDKPNGIGKMSYANGNVCVGEFKDGNCNGQEGNDTLTKIEWIICDYKKRTA